MSSPFVPIAPRLFLYLFPKHPKCPVHLCQLLPDYSCIFSQNIPNVQSICANCSPTILVSFPKTSQMSSPFVPIAPRLFLYLFSKHPKCPVHLCQLLPDYSCIFSQ